MNLEEEKLLKCVGKGVLCKVIREITEADKTGYRP